MQGTRHTYGSPQSSRSQPIRFVDHMQQLFGDDPDPLFLEESWAVGVPAAIENLHRRRRLRGVHPAQSDCSGDDRAIRELERMTSLTVDVFTEDCAQPILRGDAAPSHLDEVAWSTDLQEVPPSIPCHLGIVDANDLLGVSPVATRDEIRSAYRRKVSQCHPDRCQDASEVVRRRATQQLADLNEAYRMLCVQLLQAA